MAVPASPELEVLLEQLTQRIQEATRGLVRDVVGDTTERELLIFCRCGTYYAMQLLTAVIKQWAREQVETPTVRVTAEVRGSFMQLHVRPRQPCPLGPTAPATRCPRQDKPKRWQEPRNGRRNEAYSSARFACASGEESSEKLYDEIENNRNQPSRSPATQPIAGVRLRTCHWAQRLPG